MSSKLGILDPVRVRIRRFQFVVGLGFLSQVIGAVLSVALAYRLAERIQDLPDGLKLLVGIPLQNLWAIAVLPLLCYGAARIIELKPLSTAVGGVASGLVFVLVLNFAWGGLEGLWPGLAAGSLQISALAAGVLLSYRAVLKGRAAAAQGALKAQAQAESRKVEYQEFLREAERGAEKTAQREAERAAAAASGGSAAVAVAPDSGAVSSGNAVAGAEMGASGASSPESASPGVASTDAPGEAKAPTTGS
ncbi:hypothetical protein [Hyalangium sp.]|uniref:hypothetical protein n=1 Tax=Hyalangium sp. TaxID=2028555 RepID=UPI002D731CC4|nr:hypothetical protein [Hyalangium sp.]HYH99535.1 hypothetical protein [Hyalangium sp.]